MWGQAQLLCVEQHIPALCSASPQPGRGHLSATKDGVSHTSPLLRITSEPLLDEIQTWGEHTNMAKIEEGSYNSWDPKSPLEIRMDGGSDLSSPTSDFPRL